MPRFLFISFLAVVLAACGGGQEDAGSGQTVQDGPEAKEDSGSKPKSRDARWALTVDGRPALSGRTITGITAGGYGNYSLASEEATISVTLTQDKPNSDLSIKYNDDAVRCANFGEARISAQGDRAVISGEVECFASGQDSASRQKAGVEGWFQIKK